MSQENAVFDPLIRELMESAATGEAAKLFLQSDLGRHLTARASDDVDEAIEKLIEADPNDSARILALQTEIKVAKQAIIYLTDAIASGDNAMRALHEES